MAGSTIRSEKKPLDPVLAELVYGYWPANAARGGKTTLVVEQVSHHPPIAAYRIEILEKGVTLTGHSAQKTSFSGGSIILKQVGHAVLTVSLPSGDSEEYLITLPRLRIDGLSNELHPKLYWVALYDSHSGATFHDVASPKEEITVAYDKYSSNTIPRLVSSYQYIWSTLCTPLNIVAGRSASIFIAITAPQSSLRPDLITTRFLRTLVSAADWRASLSQR
ncbi:hypothetical protein BDR05DRAFT_953372 [Suillus weaverae]|nr:hypothetical protein BDR05DRAFT_953372 [Suillus weaverae]